MTVTFSIRGKPVAQGSMRAFIPPGRRFPIMHHVDSAALADWRERVARSAKVAWGALAGQNTIDPVHIELAFTFAPPHRPSTSYPVRPDLDKLVRAVLDALSGIVFEDDSQVVRLAASKAYGEPGLAVTLATVHD